MDVVHRLRVKFVLVVLCAFVLAGLPHFAIAQGNQHTVQPGESLGSIARLYGTDMKTLAQLNGLDDPNLIWVGQVLLLPDSASGTQRSGYGGGRSASGAVDEAPRAQARVEQQEEWGGEWSRPENNGRVSWADESEGGSEVYIDHTIRRGETLSRIAARYRTTVDAILQINPWVDADALMPGTRLSIPMVVGGGRRSASTQGTQDRSVAESSYAEPVVEIAATYPGEKWIDVDLSEQKLTAYEGSVAVRTFVISSGAAGTPTVTGSFRTWHKTPLQDMYGGSKEAGTYYFQADVPWVQYFYADYALHGAYWHNNFGRPTGHGCVNLRVADSEWLYQWSPLGTRVEVHEGGYSG